MQNSKFLKQSFIPKELRPDVSGQNLELSQKKQNLSIVTESFIKDVMLEDIINIRSRRSLIPKLIMYNINNPDKKIPNLDLLKIMFPKTADRVKKFI